jgi:spore germination protein YaaH
MRDRFSRKRWWWLLFVVFPLQHDQAPADRSAASAYVAWWLPDSWQQAAQAPFERLAFFHLNVGANGGIAEANGWPERWSELRAATTRRGLPLDLTLTVLDSETFSSVFESSQAAARLLDAASQLAAQAGVSGIQLDFEVYDAPSAGALRRFREFVPALADRLDAMGPPRQLSLFMPLGGDVQIYDAISLSRAHRVVVQGYDAHWSDSPRAGPVAPLDGPGSVTWKKGVAQARALGVPERRIVMAFPYFGYEWAVRDRRPDALVVERGETTTLARLPAGTLPNIPINVQDRVAQYGCTHDEESGSSYYTYQRPGGQWVVGWYEGTWALNRKQHFVEEQRLGGVAFFVHGYDGNRLTQQFFRDRAVGWSNSTECR